MSKVFNAAIAEYTVCGQFDVWGLGMDQERREIGRGSRLFVVAVFGLLAVTFWAVPVMLWLEFGLWRGDWQPQGPFLWYQLLTSYSHLFVFYPVLGCLALVAFYIPASVFVDIYFRPWEPPLQIRGAALRFGGWTLALAVLSVLGASWLEGGRERSLFEFKPEVLAANPSGHASCAGPLCQLQPAARALGNLRFASIERIGISRLSRICQPDQLIEAPRIAPSERYCLPSGALQVSIKPPLPFQVPRSAMMSDSSCCAVQRAFVDDLATRAQAQGNMSLTGWVHSWTMAFKFFFLLVLLAISILLAFRRAQVDRYRGYAHRLDNAVILGVLAMSLWPLMNHAHAQTISLLYGSGEGSLFRQMPHVFSAIYALWALFIIWWFTSRESASAQGVAKTAGLIVSGMAVLNYDVLVDTVAYLLGAGANPYGLAGLLLMAAGGAVVGFMLNSRPLEPKAAPMPKKETGP